MNESLVCFGAWRGDFVVGMSRCNHCGRGVAANFELPRRQCRVGNVAERSIKSEMIYRQQFPRWAERGECAGLISKPCR